MAKHFVPTYEDAQEEEWREIPEYEKYEVSSHGRVRYGKSGNVLAQRTQVSGFPVVNMLKDGKIHTRLVHTLVARAFVGPSQDGFVVRHVNGDKVDNRLENLRYEPRRKVRGQAEDPEAEAARAEKRKASRKRRASKKDLQVTDAEVDALSEAVTSPEDGVDNSEEL